MATTGVLDQFPDTTQNPLLPLTKFADFCCERFRSASPSTMHDKLRVAARAGVLSPLVVYEKDLFYSIFQVWQVQQLRRSSSRGASDQRIATFEPVLRLLAAIQDYYLPEVRGNRRMGQ